MNEMIIKWARKKMNGKKTADTSGCENLFKFLN